MSRRAGSGTVRRTAALASVASLAGLALLAAQPAAGAAAASGGRPVGTVTAVLTVAPSAHLPLAVPGGTVLDVLPAVRTEVVRAPAGALVRFAASDPAVTGLLPDVSGRVAGHDWGGDRRHEREGSDPGVFAPAEVGGDAGRPGAGAGVTVALLDTGVSDTAALNRAGGHLVDALDVSGLTAGEPARTSGTFTDGYGHGTFLASLIAGGPVPGSHGRPIGVAPGATVDVVKVADDNGVTSLWQILAGLDWVATHASSVNVVNLSFAMQPATYPVYGADPLTTAVQLVRDAGVTVVAAAGNTPGQVGDPGMTPQAITVGASDLATRSVADFSGYGNVDGVSKPDLVASGVHVLGLTDPQSLVSRDYPAAWQPDGLFRGSGTSEATAIVSGAAAVLLGKDPWLPPVGVKAALRTLADPLGDSRAGAGQLDLAGADSGPGRGGWSCWHSGHADCGRWKSSDPSGEAALDSQAWWDNAWLGGQWAQWLASSWSASSWSASSWSASSWSASSWSASSWSASSWSASSWSASSWSASSWGNAP